jgi:hypothetical protein
MKLAMEIEKHKTESFDIKRRFSSKNLLSQLKNHQARTFVLTSAYHFAVNSFRLHSVVLTLAQRIALMKDVYDVERSANEKRWKDVEKEKLSLQ